MGTTVNSVLLVSTDECVCGGAFKVHTNTQCSRSINNLQGRG